MEIKEIVVYFVPQCIAPLVRLHWHILPQIHYCLSSRQLLIYTEVSTKKYILELTICVINNWTDFIIVNMFFRYHVELLLLKFSRDFLNKSDPKKISPHPRMDQGC